MQNLEPIERGTQVLITRSKAIDLNVVPNAG
jgi:hypothetical protein